MKFDVGPFAFLPVLDFKDFWETVGCYRTFRYHLGPLLQDWDFKDLWQMVVFFFNVNTLSDKFALLTFKKDATCM